MSAPIAAVAKQSYRRMLDATSRLRAPIQAFLDDIQQGGIPIERDKLDELLNRLDRIDKELQTVRSELQARRSDQTEFYPEPAHQPVKKNR